jgi:hypothetical protein
MSNAEDLPYPPLRLSHSVRVFPPPLDVPAVTDEEAARLGAAIAAAEKRNGKVARLTWLGVRMTADALLALLEIAEAMPQRTDIKAPFEAEAPPCSTR